MAEQQVNQQAYEAAVTELIAEQRRYDELRTRTAYYDELLQIVRRQASCSCAKQWHKEEHVTVQQCGRCRVLEAIDQRSSQR